MSIVKMKKMSLVAHKSERSKLMRIFLKSGCVELTETPLCELTNYPVDVAKRETLESKRLKVSFALTFLKETLKEEARLEKDPPKANFKKENRLVAVEEYETVAREEVEIFSEIAGMEKINARLLDIKGEKSRVLAYKEQLHVYHDVEIPFSLIKDSETAFMVAGTVPETKVAFLQEKLPELCEAVFYDGDKLRPVVICGHKEAKSETDSLLASSDFVRCPFTFDATAAQEEEDAERKIFQLDKEREETLKKVTQYIPLIGTLKVLYDYYTIEIAKCAITERSPHTKSAFLMEGWVPADKAEKVKAEVEDKSKRTEIEFRDPTDEEVPPTLTKNIGPVGAFEGITDMFGPPSYREQDPNLFVALFYFLFFGIMISDAGYGILMAIACFAAVKILKPVKNSGKMLLMFGFCGISTVIWGALFGGWFGITLPEGSFLEKISWFNPLNEPLKMFMLALGMGVLQIGTGFALKGVALIKEGHPLQGIFNQFSWVIIFIGLCLISPKLMLFLGAINTSPEPAWFGVCATVGMYVALVGAAMLLIGGALGKKNPVKMVFGSLGNAYGAINVVSDLLSYSRLFGLGLTTGVIGYVINMLADIIVNTFFHGFWASWIIAVPILIIGHTFNIAINLLGAYVHNSRLQYIEFFGRFYDGSGHAFKPLGSVAKYTYPDN